MSELNHDRRILVLARVGRDAELICSALHRHGLESTPLASPDDVFPELNKGAAAAIVTEESLNGSGEAWGLRLRAQPGWSDFPIIVLTGGNGGSEYSSRTSLYRSYGNVTLLERPLRSESLLSAVAAAVRARQRQYEIRDFLRGQAESQEALRRTEKLAVAGRMAASIAHEINNPLAAVTNLLYLVSASDDLDSAKKYADIAQDELRRVADIANQTLRFYRAPKEPEPVKAGAVVDSAVALFRSKLKSQGISVNRQYSPKDEFIVSVGELRQVVVNLIANAIDAMKSGGTLQLRTAPACHPSDGRPGMKITVADDGEGIPAAIRSRLFQPLFTTKGTTGTGLGLWLTRDIVERSGGYIRCRSHNHPHGAVFTAWLPLAPTASATSSQSQVA